MKIVQGEYYIRKDGKIVQVVSPVIREGFEAHVTLRVVKSAPSNFGNYERDPYILSCSYFKTLYTKLNKLQRILLCN